MKIIEKIQFESFNPDSYVLSEDISKMLQDKKLKQVNIIVGICKDEAYDVLKESFDIAHSNGVDIEFTIGFDRKSISKDTLADMLNISKSVYVYNNNAHDDFNAKMYIFKFDKKVEVIIPTTNFTLKGITTDYSNISKITFELPADEKEYNDFMYGVKEYIYPSTEIFQLLNDKLLEELTLKRELMSAKGKNDSLPSIEDYLKKTADMHRKISDEEIEEKIKSKLNDIIQEFDVQIDSEE